MDIWRAAEVLNRRKWLILFSVVITTLLTFGATRLTGSRWVATVRFVSPQVLPSAGRTMGDAPRPPTIDEKKTLEAMYSAIITSREVIEPALKTVKEDLPSGTNFLNDIDFKTDGANLYALHVTNSNRDRAQKIANALADSFVQRNHSIQTQESQRVVQLLTDQLKEADEKLAKARSRYQEYSREHNVLGSPDQEFRVAETEMETSRVRHGQVLQDLASAQAKLGVVETRLAEIAPALNKPRPILNGPSAKSLEDQLDRAEANVTALQARYFENYPPLQEAISARDDLRVQLEKARPAEAQAADYDDALVKRDGLQKNAADLKSQIAELQAQAAALSNTLAGAEGRIQRSRELGDPFGSLASDVASLVEARSGLLTRLQNAELAMDISQRQNPLVIMSRVDSMNPPVNTSSGKTKKLILLAALCSLLGAAALVIALDSLDRRVKSVHEVERILPARVLAAIPQLEGSMEYAALARVAEEQPQSLAAEAYRFLGLHLLSAAGPQVRSLMALSAKAEQGSTTTITNLAITLAQAGHSVVLVDANTRTPELHQVFKTRNEFGFTDLLMDPTASSFEKALKETSVRGLQVVTSGAPPENRWELFRSENLVAVSRRLREIADYVLYDTPSGVVFTDALNLAPVVDAAFLCVRALEQPTGAEQRLLDLVDQANVQVLGAVLSHVPVSMVAGYENYRHYYAPSLRALTAGVNETESREKVAAVASPYAMDSLDDRNDSRNGSNGGNGSMNDHGNDGRKEM